MPEASPIAERILIIKLSALGDVLRTTSLLGPLRRRHPGVHVTWLTARAARPLLDGNPAIDDILTPDETPALRGRRFDLVLSFEEDETTAKLADEVCRGELVGVHARGSKLHYTISSAPYYDMSLLNRSGGGSLEIADALKAANRLTYPEIWLKALGLPKPRRRSELRPALFLSKEELAQADRTAKAWDIAPHRAIGFNPGAGSRWPAKQLSEETAIDLAQTLSTLGRPLVLFGGTDETDRNLRISAECRRRGLRLRDAGTGHSIRNFSALLGLCELVVTTDSLALHVAAALRRKAVVLVGPTSAAELDCFGLGEKLLPPEPCSCFYQPRCRLARRCLDRISPDAVLRAARRWLS